LLVPDEDAEVFRERCSSDEEQRDKEKFHGR